MALIDIDGALIQAYVDLAIGLDTAYENVAFTPPDDGSDWAKVSIVPAVVDYASLGSGGQDLHEGFMQIDFKTPHGKGRAGLVAYAQTIIDEFVGGKSYTQNSQNVRIDTVDRSQIVEEDGFMSISITVNWDSIVIRPTF